MISIFWVLKGLCFEVLIDPKPTEENEKHFLSIANLSESIGKGVNFSQTNSVSFKEGSHVLEDFSLKISAANLSLSATSKENRKPMLTLRENASFNVKNGSLTLSSLEFYFDQRTRGDLAIFTMEANSSLFIINCTCTGRLEASLIQFSISVTLSIKYSNISNAEFGDPLINFFNGEEFELIMCFFNNIKIKSEALLLFNQFKNVVIDSGLISNVQMAGQLLKLYSEESENPKITITKVYFINNTCSEKNSDCHFMLLSSDNQNNSTALIFQKLYFSKNEYISTLRTENSILKHFTPEGSSIELQSPLNYFSFFAFTEEQSVVINDSISIATGEFLTDCTFFHVQNRIVELKVTNFLMKKWKSARTFGFLINLNHSFTNDEAQYTIYFENAQFAANSVINIWREGQRLKTSQFGAAVSLTGLSAELNIIVTMRNVNFTLNKIEKSEYTLVFISFPEKNSVNITIERALIERNEFQLNSQMCFFRGARVEMMQGHFIRNNGSLLLGSNYVSFVLRQTLFYFNKVYSRGSLMTLSSLLRNQAKINISQVLFLFNSGKLSSIMIKKHFSIWFFIGLSIFYNNTSEVDGASCTLDFRGKVDTHIVNMSSCIFSRNRARNGGVGKFGNLGGTVIIQRCKFWNNSAERLGGSLLINTEIQTIIHLQYNIFQFSNANKTGGVVFLLLGNVTESFCLYLSNIAERGSAYVISSYAELNSEDSIFMDNLNAGTAVINSQGKSKTSIKRAIFIKNLSVLKGVVLAVYGFAKMIISESILLSNSDFLYSSNLANTTIKMSSNIFLEGDSTISLIYLHNSNATLEEMKFIRNKGSLFELSFANLTLTKSLIQQHRFEKCSSCVSKRKSYLLRSEQTDVYIETSSFSSLRPETAQEPLLQVKGHNLLLSETTFENVISGNPVSLLIAYDASVIIKSLSTSTCSNNLFYFQASNIDVSNSIFQGKQLGSNVPSSFKALNALKLINCNRILIQDSKFIGFNESSIDLQLEDAAVSYQSLKIFTLTAKNCIFQSNSKADAFSVGAGLKVLNSNVELYGCTFQENKADFGAGIDFFCDTSNSFLCMWIIKSCVFFGNEARSRGAGLFWIGKVPVEIENAYEMNSAIDSPDKASFPERLEFCNSAQEFLELTRAFSSYLSGVAVNTSMKLCLKDYYNQTVTVLTRTIKKQVCVADLALTEPSQNLYKDSDPKTFHPYLTEPVSSLFFNGIFVYEKLKLIAIPNNSYNIAINSPLLENQGQRNNSKALEISVQFSECSLGFVYDKENGVCKYCSKGEFSLSAADHSCRICPGRAVCEGGSSIFVQKGFWRSSNESWNIIQCESNTACKGGLNSECERGWEGPLCGACTGNFFMNSEECTECRSVILSLIPFFLFFFLIVLYQMITIRLKMRVKDFTQSVFLKIFLNYLKLTGVIKISKDWPLGLGEYLKFQNSVGDPSRVLFSLDCILMSVAGPQINVFYKRLLFISLLSLLYPGLVFLSFKIRNHFFADKDHAFELKYKFTLSLLVIILSLQSFFLNTFFSSLTCIKIEGVLYLKEKPSLKCWSDEHTFLVNVLSLPFIIIWILIIPCVMLYTLIRNRRTLRSRGIGKREVLSTKRTSILDGQAIEKAFAFLTDGYQDKYFYWEFTFLFQNICVIFINSFVYQETLQSYIFSTVFFVSFVIQVYIEPYHNSLLNKTQFYSSLCCFVSFTLMGIIASTATSSLLKPVLIIGTFIVNGFFLLHWSVNFLILKKDSVKWLFTSIGRFTIATKREKRSTIMSTVNRPRKGGWFQGAKVSWGEKKPLYS